MKHTDFSSVDNRESDKISDLVRSCSFNFKTWQEVLQHPALVQGVADAQQGTKEPLTRKSVAKELDVG